MNGCEHRAVHIRAETGTAKGRAPHELLFGGALRCASRTLRVVRFLTFIRVDPRSSAVESKKV
jgi:hypothetical protein